MVFLLLVTTILLAKYAQACMNGGVIGGDATKIFLENTDIGPFPSDASPVIDSDQLTCSFGGSTFPNLNQCSWHNIELGDQFNWMRAKFTKPVDSILFQSFTGKRDVPTGDFLFAGDVQGRSGSDVAVLQADIPCQNGPSVLSFSHWASSELPKLQVCIQNAFGRRCEPFINRNQPNPVTITIPDQGREPFQVRLEASGFTQPSVVMVDDISYNADICDDGPTTIRPGPAGSCEVVNCDFNSGTSCLYETKGEGFNSGQWNVGAGRVGNPHTGVQKANPGDGGIDKTFRGAYAYVGRDQVEVPSGAVYVLESPQFTLTQDADLFFDVYRRSVGPVLEVRNAFNNEELWTTRNVRVDPDEYWQEQRIGLRKNEPYKLLFKLTEMKKNLYIGVDNISVSPGASNSDPNICRSTLPVTKLVKDFQSFIINQY